MKEFYHIRRQPITLFFMLVVPVMQTIIFGYAIDTQIENIPMVVFDLDGRQARVILLPPWSTPAASESSNRSHDESSFDRALTSGRAKVGLRIPPYYTRPNAARRASPGPSTD